MSLTQTIRRLLRRLEPKQNTRSDEEVEMLHKLVRTLKNTSDEEYSCDEAFRLLDQYAELVQSGEDAANLMPLVQRHLAMCGNCLDEFETLLKVLEAPQV